MEFSTFGRHVAMDAWGVNFDLLNDAEFLREKMEQAAVACGATILSVQSQQFDPQGATVLVMLSESHLSIHTYPEKGFAALDCYTCGHTVDPMVAIEYMLEALQPTQAVSKVLRRGDGPIEVVQPEHVGSKKLAAV
ncbi:S-adenosylmethionine decarboxylase [Thermoactinomyces sp. DSM 45891]|uniref:S-adenosylmethionine decarboxylase proenzyme n=1 Tax=Croceifilum oryzae TaxID=1553429 RepID=A0AAJ1TCU1_9BACL|nr:MULTISPECIES: adenosylmethionine decarboxylase [Thermoactinomycetaceae]MDQ0416049.1 S-adenosylmethionine decarboxylase [Croceifilum oryzae]SFX19684.1 S-adenosylmethionine decarboxylase [Thermoactinomyces sp. DSM 45891]